MSHTWNLTKTLTILKRIKELTPEDRYQLGFALCGVKSYNRFQGELYELIIAYLYIMEKTHWCIYSAFGDYVQKIEEEYEK